MKLLKRKNAVVTLYIVFFVMAIIVLFTAAFLGPLGVKINSQMYVAGERMLRSSNETIASIQDDTVRTNLQLTLQGALDNTQHNIEVNANLFKYSWIFVVGIGALILFITARVITETQRGYGGVI